MATPRKPGAKDTRKSPATAPKWPWADIKAQYYLAYPISKAEFFSKRYPQIPVKTWTMSTVGWKEEREAYRLKFALENVSKYLKQADKTAERHAEKGAGLMDAAMEKLVTTVIDGKTGERQYVLKATSNLEPAEILRAFYVGAKVEAEAQAIRRAVVTIHKDANEKPEKEVQNADKTLLQAILKSKPALKAAKELLKALPAV